MVVNGFVVYKQLRLDFSDLDALLMKDFRIGIARGLITEPSRRISASRIPVTIKRYKKFVPKDIRLKGARHQPAYSTRRRCALCSTKLNQVRTNWICVMCNVPLCLGKNKTCFEKYHSPD